MIFITAFGSLAIVIVLFLGLEACAYRRPWVLLLAGLLASGFSVILKATPIFLKSVPNLPWSSEELDVAASVVDSTLIGLAGGLIASAFVLKLQVLQACDLTKARDSLKCALERIGDAERADEDLRLVARTLTDEEFRTRLRWVRRMQLDALIDRYEAQAELQKLDVPGLK